MHARMEQLHASCTAGHPHSKAEFESYRTHFPAPYMYQVATSFGPNVGASDPYYYCSQCKEQVGFDSYLTCLGFRV